MCNMNKSFKCLYIYVGMHMQFVKFCKTHPQINHVDIRCWNYSHRPAFDWLEKLFLVLISCQESSISSIFWNLGVASKNNCIWFEISLLNDENLNFKVVVNLYLTMKDIMLVLSYWRDYEDLQLICNWFDYISEYIIVKYNSSNLKWIFILLLYCVHCKL